MSIPVHVTFRHLKTRPELEAEILTLVAHLEQFYDRIVDCRVLIELPHRRRGAGNLYRVVIELTVPQDRLVITHDVSRHAAMQDLCERRMRRSMEREAAHKYLREALYDAFRAAGRQLQDYAGRHRDALRHV
jgi:ribosome-associated translation inhibitor RaiA